jgi:pyruvate/2-oxoglutarate dehydrogenase complex dihydrolipoamide dehydrogenase (E3) component
MIHTDEDDEFERIERENKIKGQPYHFEKREWVGLTEEEMKKTWYEMKNIMGWYSFEEIARAIEAKLKEKNEKT